MHLIIHGKSDDLLNEKTEQEIKFLGDKIIAMMNKLNKINFLNSILTEEKIYQNNEKSGESSNKGQNSKTSSETEESSSKGASKESSSNSNDSSEGNNVSSSNENTKFEVRNGGILANNTNQEIDWEFLKVNTETIYSIWPTVVSDLNALNVNKQDILNFSNALDLVTISVKNEDKVECLKNLANLYTFIPNYKRQFSKDIQKVNIDYTISAILDSYCQVEQNNWQEVKNQVNNAINYYSKIMDTVNENYQNQNRVSKTYILLNELNNNITTQDKELYYIKYRNVMEELINL